MNSYKENLRTGVTSTLADIEKMITASNASLDAATATLRFAKGALAQAVEQEQKLSADLAGKNELLELAARACYLAGDAMQTAGQQKAYSAQSASNSAVAAANVQVAANAVVRLASDLGSINSIVIADDYGSAIAQLTGQVYETTNDTALSAEKASMKAMEASIAAAEVPSGAIADIALRLKNIADELLSSIAEGTGKTATALANEVANRQTLEKNVHQADAVAKDLGLENEAVKASYEFTCKQLNMGLSVPAGQVKSDSFTVVFDLYRPAFSGGESVVSEYRIAIVKEEKKFVTSTSRVWAAAQAKGVITFSDAEFGADVTSVNKSIQLAGLTDIDGDKLFAGRRYVVFLQVVFTDDYKKQINNFEDMLSAPSNTFSVAKP